MNGAVAVRASLLALTLHIHPTALPLAHHPGLGEVERKLQFRNPRRRSLSLAHATVLPLLLSRRTDPAAQLVEVLANLLVLQPQVILEVADICDVMIDVQGQRTHMSVQVVLVPFVELVALDEASAYGVDEVVRVVGQFL